MKMSDEVREVFRKMGRKGGRARAAKLTAEQKSEIGRKAVAARKDRQPKSA